MCLKTLAAIALLVLLTPVSLVGVCIALVWRSVLMHLRREAKETARALCRDNGIDQKKADASNQRKHTVMITGAKMTKSLQLARTMAKAGHRVVLVETHKYWLTGHAFSNAVSAFHTVPAPEKNPEGYYQGLCRIAKEEGVTEFLPVSSPVASYHDSVAKSYLERIPNVECKALTFDAETCRVLDDKYLFCKLAQKLGLRAPEVHHIADRKEILDFDFDAHKGQKYIVKSLRYDSVSRLDLTRLPNANMQEFVAKLPISKGNPWVMQEFIKGKEYCTHSFARNGVLKAYGCSESSPFQVNYSHVNKPKIYEWVRQFVKKTKLTGQVSFDFIEAEDGSVFPIECNPRTHSAVTMFHDHPSLAQAYVSDKIESPIVPLESSRPTYFTGHEIHRLVTASSWMHRFAIIKRIVCGTDAIFSLDDPMPFLMVYHWHIPLLLLGALQKGKEWLRIDFNIGKLVEVGGD